MAEATGETNRDDWRELDHLVPVFQTRASKLRPARAHLELVERTALVGALLESPASLVVVSAPAGYGKSTLLAQWADAAPVATSWLQLDATDNDPVVFLTYLTAALSKVAPVDPTVADLLQVEEPPIDELILPRLGDALDAAEPFLLVLDDAHLVQSEACWRHLAVMIEQLPPSACLALGTRSDPTLPIDRLRAAGRLAEVRLGDLRLTRAEARELLRLHGAEADDEALDGLLDLTEGWATGLYLAVLAGEGRPAREWLPRLHGDLHAIAGYLTAEVLERQPRELKEFLLRTSILDQLCPGLCRAVTGDDDAHRLLGRLANDNLFVVALDDRDHWHRYHNLFEELLRAQLESQYPKCVPDLHRRASAWYRANGDSERAVRHAIAAGDAGDVVHLAVVAADDYVCRYQMERAYQLVARFTDRQIYAHAELALMAGMVGAYVAHPRVQRWAQAAGAMVVGEGPAPLGVTSLRSWQLITRAMRARDGVARMLADATLACELEVNGDDSWRLAAQTMRCLALYLSGRSRQARAVIDKVMPSCPRGDEEEVWWLGMLALLAAEQGCWDEAEEYDRQVGEGRTAVLQTPPVLARALVRAHSGGPGLAASLAQAERDIRFVSPTSEVRLILASVIFAEIALGRDDSAAAERWTAEAEARLLRYPDAGMLRGRAQRLREALEQRRLTQPLTPAERRVLDLLPTQLSAPQIAARLFLSANTVKTHGSHLYAKLGVTTRTDAVERARELGLLRPPEQS